LKTKEPGEGGKSVGSSNGVEKHIHAPPKIMKGPVIKFKREEKLKEPAAQET